MTNNNFLVIENVCKNYEVVQALRGVSFDIRKGEIHTVLGENGAGKSTLMRIIAGEQAPDSGNIYLEGEKIAFFSPKHAHKLGISMVHQELAIFENMSVAENIFPDCNFRNRFGGIDKKRLYMETNRCQDILKLNLNPSSKMDSLTVAEQQMVEILRAISLENKIIVLDEPTSSLNNKEAERLMQTLKKLRDDGLTIIYISHRINEILDISDRVTVLRDGEYICTLENDKNLDENVLVSKMVGRNLQDSIYMKKNYIEENHNEILLKVENLCKKHSATDISFTLHKGEIIGFFGLEGSGTEDVSRMIFGLESKDKGTLHFKGETISKYTPIDLIDRKILYLNGNRKNAGLLLKMPATENMSLPVLKKLSKLSFLNQQAIKEYTNKYIEKFSIVISSVLAVPSSLSGGNQQKLMLSICLGTEPECLIVNEPTRGIDVGAKTEIHMHLQEIANSGVGVIVFSSELPELISLVDRIIIMRNKKIVGELMRNEIQEQNIMALAAVGEVIKERVV
ncbi:MAG: D-xylose ABC transporter ATP-binding protein [Firmicutes bacterium HGW-Firmicutes-1]|jgi:ABC-type sugar transport system ATPase subunit|nr:MAG: D-xylose ABC transporter ATP-binding protein [Firmicutes bacterium HGW-Firmicutes-1]